MLMQCTIIRFTPAFSPAVKAGHNAASFYEIRTYRHEAPAGGTIMAIAARRDKAPKWKSLENLKFCNRSQNLKKFS